jgi:hypothetical protein
MYIENASERLASSMESERAWADARKILRRLHDEVVAAKRSNNAQRAEAKIHEIEGWVMASTSCSSPDQLRALVAEKKKAVGLA